MVVTVYEVSSFIVLVMADFAYFFYSIKQAVHRSVAGQHHEVHAGDFCQQPPFLITLPLHVTVYYVLIMMA